MADCSFNAATTTLYPDIEDEWWWTRALHTLSHYRKCFAPIFLKPLLPTCHYQSRAMRQQQGMSQSTGYNFPQKQKVKLALGSTHRECYLPGIVVVILCPVWQCINEQHANTFCRNICNRHIFRLPSKSEKKGKENVFDLPLSPLEGVRNISCRCTRFVSLFCVPLCVFLSFKLLLVCRTKHKFSWVVPKDEEIIQRDVWQMDNEF